MERRESGEKEEEEVERKKRRAEAPRERALETRGHGVKAED